MCEKPIPDERSCRHCAQPIPQKASVCHNCGKHQRLLWSVVERIGVMGSVLLVLLAFLQFRETHQERVKSQDALSQAQQARNEAQAAAAQAQETAERTARAESDLRQQVLSVTKMFYLQVVTRNDFTAERGGKAAKEILNELDAAIILAIPDVQRRNKWIRELHDLMPETREKQMKLSNK